MNTATCQRDREVLTKRPKVLQTLACRSWPPADSKRAERGTGPHLTVDLSMSIGANHLVNHGQKSGHARERVDPIAR